MNPADPQSFNRYAYVQNDPVNFVDPSGLLMAPFIVYPGGDYRPGLVWQYIAGFGEGPPDVGFGSGGDFWEGGNGLDPNPQQHVKPSQGTNPCLGVKPNDLIYDSDRVKYKDAKNALEHITNRHIRTDINQAASKYEFGYGLAGRSDANSIAGKQAAVINLNQATFAIAPAVPLPGGDLAFTVNFSFLDVSAPFSDFKLYVGYDNSKSGGGRLTQVNTVIVKGDDCRTVVSSNPGGIGIRN
jgi:hypothetical protein